MTLEGTVVTECMETDAGEECFLLLSERKVYQIILQKKDGMKSKIFLHIGQNVVICGKELTQHIIQEEKMRIRLKVLWGKCIWMRKRN